MPFSVSDKSPAHRIVSEGARRLRKWISSSFSSEISGSFTAGKLEEIHLRKILDRTPSLTEAAQILGIDQATLYRKRKKIGLE